VHGSPLFIVPPSAGRVHLVTGATGFVGGALVLELLERTGDQVVGVVRPGRGDVRARLFEGLLHAARAYNSPLDPAEIADRCRAVEGDVLAEGCGLDLERVGPVDQVWHSAASLRYESRYREEIEATNVGGTRNVLTAAERLGVCAFNYVSTAYVSGRREGWIKEAPAGDTHTHNHYERSKVEAERLVSAARGMIVRILRPSVVVGHSRTLAATAFSGFYGFVRQLVQFRGMVDRTQKGLLANQPMRVRLDTDATIDLVAIDAVAREAVAIGSSDTTAGVYHLTHRDPPTLGLVVRTLFAMCGLHQPQFVSSPDELTWLDKQFDERLDFYGAYMRGDRRFERRRTEAALPHAKAARHVVYDAAEIDRLGRWYLERLEQERSRLPAAR
jgi:nucleoside-diphosphate-sugar epimerase